MVGFKVNVADNFDELVHDHVVYQMMMSETKEEYPIILEGVHKMDEKSREIITLIT